MYSPRCLFWSVNSFQSRGLLDFHRIHSEARNIHHIVVAEGLSNIYEKMAQYTSKYIRITDAFAESYLVSPSWPQCWAPLQGVKYENERFTCLCYTNRDRFENFLSTLTQTS